jgi:hypothetical protein
MKDMAIVVQQQHQQAAGDDATLLASVGNAMCSAGTKTNDRFLVWFDRFRRETLSAGPRFSDCNDNGIVFKDLFSGEFGAKKKFPSFFL